MTDPLNDHELIRTIANLQPSKQVRVFNPKFSKSAVQQIYKSFENGTSWTDINTALAALASGDRSYSRPATLALAMQAHAEHYGVPVFKRQQGRKAA